MTTGTPRGSAATGRGLTRVRSASSWRTARSWTFSGRTARAVRRWHSSAGGSRTLPKGVLFAAHSLAPMVWSATGQRSGPGPRDRFAPPERVLPISAPSLDSTTFRTQSGDPQDGPCPASRHDSCDRPGPSRTQTAQSTSARSAAAPSGRASGSAPRGLSLTRSVSRPYRCVALHARSREISRAEPVRPNLRPAPGRPRPGSDPRVGWPSHDDGAEDLGPCAVRIEPPTGESVRQPDPRMPISTPAAAAARRCRAAPGPDRLRRCRRGPGPGRTHVTSPSPTKGAPCRSARTRPGSTDGT